MTDTYLASYLLTRALGWRSRSSAELVRCAYDTAYRALAADRLPEDAWRLLDVQIPWVFLSWDRCLRLRNAVATLFIERNLSPATFVRLTSNDTYFEHLAYAAVRSYGGRAFLERTLMELGGEYDATRRKVVEEAIVGSWRR